MEPITALNAVEDKSVAKLASQLLPAWHDKVAGVTAFTGAITTAPLFRDGHRLVIADDDRKLKVRSHPRSSHQGSPLAHMSSCMTRRKYTAHM